MNLSASLLLISPFVFGILGILSAVNFARKPDRVRRDAALMLNALSISLVLSTIVFAFSSRNEFLETVASILLLAHPFLLLRLVQQFSPLRKWILQTSEAAWLVCVFLLVIDVTSPIAGIFMVVYGVSYESAAMLALIRGAKAAFGMTRLHLLLAAVGTGLLGSIALTIGFMPILPSYAPVIDCERHISGI